MRVDELNWRPHRWAADAEQAICQFPNGYSASCLRGGPFYTDGGTYEIGVLRNGSLDYTTPVTDDVLGYLSEDEANAALAQIEALPVPADQVRA